MQAAAFLYEHILPDKSVSQSDGSIFKINYIEVIQFIQSTVAIGFANLCSMYIFSMVSDYESVKGVMGLQ